VVAVSIEWAPEQPKHLSPDELAQYRVGRNAAIAELGLRAVVVELP